MTTACIDKAAARRRAQLAAIHVAANRLKLDRETYVALLHRVAGVASAADLDGAGRAKVLDELRRLSGDTQRRVRNAVPPPHAPRQVREEAAAMIGKVGAMLADAGRDWNYAHGMAQRMFHVARAEWLRADQLHKLIAALAIDQKRRKERACI